MCHMHGELLCLPLQLLASVATCLGNCRTWRRVRRSSRGWRTPPWERPSERGRDCLHKSEHHMLILICFYPPTSPWPFFCSPPQFQGSSVRAERPRLPIIWHHVPASRSPRPAKLQFRVIHANGPSRWLRHSRYHRELFKYNVIMTLFAQIHAQTKVALMPNNWKITFANQYYDHCICETVIWVIKAFIWQTRGQRDLAIH